MYYTSRSAIESRQDCPRKRYLNYHYDGIGIVPANRSIPLTTGICTHSGVELMVREAKGNTKVKFEGKSLEDLIDTAVSVAIEKYNTLLKDTGFTGTLEKEQEFVKNEQIALTEALVRSWGMKEFPLIIKDYKILEVETELSDYWYVDPTLQELFGVDGRNTILFQGKADIILETKDQYKDILIYSLKTIKDFAWYVEKSYKRDLQGITETYLTNRLLAERNIAIDNAITNSPIFLPELSEYLKKKKTNSNCSGVKFCYLVKGNRKESDFEPGHFITYNPLIRGYKKITGNGIEWAHSWFFPNPENKSGKSILGKGWEPFNVWESEHWDFSVKKWMMAIERGEIQVNCPDPIKGCVVTPVEVRRDSKEIEEDIKILREEEIEYFKKLSNIPNPSLDTFVGKYIFGKTRRRCDYPTPCDYLPVCYGEDSNGNVLDNQLVMIDPIGSGIYEKRKPHHKGEEEGLSI